MNFVFKLMIAYKSPKVVYLVNIVELYKMTKNTLVHNYIATSSQVHTREAFRYIIQE